jgi:hypothetical protein
MHILKKEMDKQAYASQLIYKWVFSISEELTP